MFYSSDWHCCCHLSHVYLQQNPQCLLYIVVLAQPGCAGILALNDCCLCYRCKQNCGRLNNF